MARTKFPVEILSPEGEVWSGEVEMVSTRTTVGSIGLLANHEPVLAMLDPVELRLYESETDIRRFAQGEGYLQVAGNRALLLVEEAHPPEDLDTGDLREKLKRAEQELESADKDTEAWRKASRDKRRWDAFLAVAEGGDAG
ncbi:MAG: F-type H+-transporting ATPase subunit epsilon [Solirubrobacteraceae bacterium]|nr:F-type H+-transporting ATPase subunit epsilon [Solirubrobacteraceae bacterium]